VARAIWSGAISFGLVNVPVSAYSAVHDHTVHFHQLDKRTGARIRYQKVSGKSGKAVADDDIEKGFELSKGKYVVVDPDEFDELRPRSTRTVEITDFVELAAVDPIYYASTYWLGATGDRAQRAYRLLLAAMEESGRVAIGSVVMRNKQYLAAIRPLDGALAMSTMRFGDEVVPRSTIDDIPSRRQKPAPKELRLATQILESLATEWDPKRYHDTYTEQMRDLIDGKAHGKDVTIEAEAEESGAQVIDLMAALEASIDAGKRGTRRAKGATKARRARGTSSSTTRKASSRRRKTA
jgi:DNA end-binding protein Ku